MEKHNPSSGTTAAELVTADTAGLEELTTWCEQGFAEVRDTPIDAEPGTIQYTHLALSYGGPTGSAAIVAFEPKWEEVRKQYAGSVLVWRHRPYWRHWGPGQVGVCCRVAIAGPTHDFEPLPEVLAECESGLEVVPMPGSEDGTFNTRSVYADQVPGCALVGQHPFVTVMGGGPKEEGERAQVSSTREDAIESFRESFAAWKATQPGTRIMWRIKPQLRRWPMWGPLGYEDDPQGYGWVVRCRVVIL